MKIANCTTPARITKTLEIKKPEGKILVTLHALPLGYEEKVMDWLPLPVPPKQYAISKKGKVLMREDTGQPLIEAVDDTPEFKAQFRHMASLQGVAFIYEGLRHDPNITWSTQEPTNDNPAARKMFFEQIYEELKAANFTTGDIALLIEEMRDISFSKPDDLVKMRESFSRGVS